MDIPEPVGPTIEKDCEEEHTSFQAQFMSDRWRHYMPHMRFRHIVLYRKVPLQMKLKLALERNIGPHAHIIVGDTVYKCQVLVFRIYCKGLFKNLKKGDVVKFPDGALSNEFFELAYAWMTSNEVHCPRDKLLDFLGAASFLHCIPLIKRVFEKLNDHRIHSELASFSCFLKARDMGITQMAGMMLSRVSKSFLVLVSNGQFLQLDIESACTLLSSSFLAVQNEIEIFYSALLWLISNYQIRKKYIPRVFGLICDQNFRISYATIYTMLCCASRNIIWTSSGHNIWEATIADGLWIQSVLMQTRSMQTNASISPQKYLSAICSESKTRLMVL
ncbi:uncharacterized protein LOC122616963 isoform X5 [Drosophila teissieri]|uniref:uncharacterized protein LOC122616963 isoform X5 n=1 Tax=Drosophila teissieri TaxID=7243 RepID=UPI001CBA15F0|nr:uncharacterized protein LOC122616963 isoform X5 [Drosophila teissieri]